MLHRVMILIFCIAFWVVVPEIESAEPPNEWGTYYSLPSGHVIFDVSFLEVFDAYANGRNPETQCQSNDADFERWYESSVNPNHYIMSYYCRTKVARGYEHIKVDMTTKTVLEFHTSLKGFKIMDAGDYEEEVAEKDGKKLEAKLLEAVKEKIAEERKDTAEKTEFCPDPGTQTLYDVKRKKENGLYYYKLAISCNVSETPGYASHMTHIEVVVDKDYKALNEGKPVLAAMDYPSRNSVFIREQEIQSDKQKDSIKKVAPGFISLILVMLISYCKEVLAWN